MTLTIETFGARLDEIRALNHGWFDGRGRSFTSSDLGWFEEAVIRWRGPLPYVFPVKNGCWLRLEWDEGRDSVRTASADVDLYARAAWYHSCDAVGESDDEIYELLDLRDTVGWEYLRRLLRDDGVS